MRKESKGKERTRKFFKNEEGMKQGKEKKGEERREESTRKKNINRIA